MCVNNGLREGKPEVKSALMAQGEIKADILNRSIKAIDLIGKAGAAFAFENHEFHAFTAEVDEETAAVYLRLVDLIHLTEISLCNFSKKILGF